MTPTALTCPEHSRECTMYCTTCRTAVCKRCTAHRGHAVCLLKTAMENDMMKNRKSFRDLTEDGKKAMMAWVTEEVKKTDELGKEMDARCKEDKEKFRVLKQSYANRVALVKDLALLEKIKTSIMNAQRSASAKVLSKTCEKALPMFNIVESIKDEAYGSDEELKRLRDQLLEEKKQIKYSAVRYMRLIALKNALESGKFNREAEAVLFLFREEELLNDAWFNSEQTLEHYVLLEDTYPLLPLHDLMKKELIDIGCGVQISEPISLDLGISFPGNIQSIAISHEGILGVSGYAYATKEFQEKQHGCVKCTRVEFRDLKTMKGGFIENSYNVRLVMYDHKAIFIENYGSFHDISLDGIFVSRDLLNEKTYNLPRCRDSINCINTQRTRVCHLVSNDKVLYELNVDTKKVIDIKTPFTPTNIITFYGYDSNISVIFSDENDEAHAIGKDGTIIECFSKVKKWIPRIFQSSSEPNICKKALLFTSNGICLCTPEGTEFCNNDNSLKDEIFSSYLVRLVDDIFISCTSYKRLTTFVRIVVP